MPQISQWGRAMVQAISKLVFATALTVGALSVTAAEAGSYGCASPCAHRPGIPADAVIFQPIYTPPTYYFQPMSCDNCYVVPRGNVYHPRHGKKRRAYRRY